VDALSKTITDVVAQIQPSVVHVRATADNGDLSGMGSGVVIDNTHVITSAQVVSGEEKEIQVQTANGRKYRASIVGVDPLYHVTVLEIDGWLGIAPPKLASSREVLPGQAVVAIGNALGHDYNVTFGVVTSVNRTVYRPERLPVDGLIITDASFHPGNTSGALVRLDGVLVGVVGIPWQHGLGLAIHSDVVWRLANQIIDYGQATHPWLGFSGEPEIIDNALVDLFDLDVTRGVTVLQVADGGPGQQAGVMVDDLVVRIKGEPVGSLGSIRQVLATHRHGESVTLTVLRNGSLVDLDFPVAEMPRLRWGKNR